MKKIYSKLIIILLGFTFLFFSRVFDIHPLIGFVLIFVGIQIFYLFFTKEGIHAFKGVMTRLKETKLLKWFSELKKRIKPKPKTTYSHTFKVEKRKGFKLTLSPKLKRVTFALVLLILFTFAGVIVLSRIDFSMSKNGSKTTNQNDQSDSPSDTVKITPYETYALIVGIDDYKYADDYSGDLKFAKDDAYAFKEFLLSYEGGQVRQENIVILTDKKATKDLIQFELERLAKSASSSDRLIFYFSGHGSGESLIPSDYSPYEQNSLTIKSIDGIFIHSKAKHKLLIADACADSGNSGKGLSKETRNGNKNINHYKPSFIHLKSCQDNESSYESEQYQNGYFSHWLIDGLNGNADADENKIITIKEIFHYVKRKVSFDVDFHYQKHQTPQLEGSADLNMPISIVKN